MSRALCSVLVALALVNPARADRIAPITSPVERALRVPVVVVGKVTGVEKETVEAPLYPGATNKVAHKIAVVKIESALAGADGITHVKIGFVPSGTAGIRPGRGPENPELKEGQEWLFFLTKHADGSFYTIPYMTPPVESKATDYKAQIERTTMILAVFADPAKALKAEKAEDRFHAAVALVARYRTPFDGVPEVEVAPLSADESRPILKALAEGSWQSEPAAGRLNGLSAFYQLGLTDADGWKQPVAKPGEDFTETTRQAFIKWLDGSGKEYKIKKLVPKKK
jgi:hypothetical protein